MNLQEQFPFIYKWGTRSGSFHPYMDMQAENARVLNAPPNTIYLNGTKAVTTDDIHNDDLIKEWNLPNKPNKEELKAELVKTTLVGVSFGMCMDMIEKCETFKEYNRLMELFKNFIHQG